VILGKLFEELPPTVSMRSSSPSVIFPARSGHMRQIQIRSRAAPYSLQSSMSYAARSAADVQKAAND